MLLSSVDRGRLLAVAFLFLLLAGLAKAEDEALSGRAANSTRHSAFYVTNVSQFAGLSNVDYIIGCNFHLSGVVTLVDTNRNLVVLQDTTGAVALNFACRCSNLQVGQSVTIDGTNACPMFSSFPDYPFRPSGREICSSFETPEDWGEYNLTRMRGYLHPRASGNYRFWIASDNSSELWLSTDANPWNARRIAFIPRFGWTAPHQWTSYTSQHSDLIQLKAGETYYIEALQEQTAQAENLSVGWQEPAVGESDISVISGDYLTPWHGDTGESNTNGILREYWTNYPAGDVAGMAGSRPFQSALTVEQASLHTNGAGELPKPDSLALDQPWNPENNYRWVSVEGVVRFRSTDNDSSQMEIFTGRKLIQVRALWKSNLSTLPFTNALVRVEGVCEGIQDPNGTMMPGLIWASAENCISTIAAPTNSKLLEAEDDLIAPTVTNNPSSQDYFQTQGIITFNDRVFDKDLIFIQGDKSVTKVALQNAFLKKQLTVGRNVELGGTLDPGKYLQSIRPFFVSDMGQQVMPLPIACPPEVPAQANLEGRWCEIEGIVRAVNTNGTLSLIGKNGLGYLWLGQASSEYLAHCVDAKLRARGVLILTMLDAPLLLIPSPSFVDVKEEAPANPFDARRCSVSKLLSDTFEPLQSHRVRVIGQVTYCDAESFFVQDTTGGIRVKSSQNPAVEVGRPVEVAAFPTTGGLPRSLAEALVRPFAAAEDIKPADLELNDTPPGQQSGTLVQVNATVLGRKTNGVDQMLEMQEEQQHFFTATLLTDHGNLPEIVPGSRLRITGIRQDQPTASAATSEQPVKLQLLSSLNILLRDPEDVKILSGPPWWTWKRTAVIGGLVLITLVVALLWTHLLRRRLEHQQAEQLAFSQHVLGKLEEERRRIAGDLHDSLGQMLMVIKHRAISATDSLNEKPGVQKSMDEISTVTSQAIEEVRRISHGLGPHQLDHLGLTRAIRASVDRASENSSVVFASRVENIDGLFERDAEILLYRIVQEAVTNILKHSAATEAAVVVKKQATAVSISIRDNGKGFDPARPSNQMDDFGYGLSGIGERVRILKGTLVIESQPSAGTSLTAEIPFKVQIDLKA
jgi:signal transduction histidine kinase